jgi:hypothetical protein
VLAGLAILLFTAANDVFLSIGLISGTFYMACRGLPLHLHPELPPLDDLLHKRSRTSKSCLKDCG